MPQLYRYIPVFRRENERIVIYNCFEVLGQGLFTVQSADFVSASTDATGLRQLQAQFFELLLEESPEIRSTPHSSVAEAIAAFDRDFSE